MFFASAANDQLQGKAIHAINERWGTDSRNRIGRETIGIPVCKKKYAPFEFRKKIMKNGRVHVQVIRLYGCTCHSHMREGVIKKAGERKGWEPFGQWSMKKAEMMAKKLIERLNISWTDSGDEDFPFSSSSDSDENPLSWKQMCHNGRCAWKMKHKYDDVVSEMQERDERK